MEDEFRGLLAGQWGLVHFDNVHVGLKYICLFTFNLCPGFMSKMKMDKVKT